MPLAGGGRLVRLQEVREEEAHVEGLQPREETAEGQPRGEGRARVRATRCRD